MIKCTECGSKRVANITAELTGICRVSVGGKVYEGDEVPDDIGVGSGSTIDFEYCLGCGIISGDFPLDATSIELEEEAEDSE